MLFVFLFAPLIRLDNLLPQLALFNSLCLDLLHLDRGLLNLPLLLLDGALRDLLQGTE